MGVYKSIYLRIYLHTKIYFEPQINTNDSKIILRNYILYSQISWLCTWSRHTSCVFLQCSFDLPNIKYNFYFWVSCAGYLFTFHVEKNVIDSHTKILNRNYWYHHVGKKLLKFLQGYQATFILIITPFKLSSGNTQRL